MKIVGHTQDDILRFFQYVSSLRVFKKKKVELSEEEVFKKADKIMYKHKNEFKAAHGSYR